MTALRLLFPYAALVATSAVFSNCGLDTTADPADDPSPNYKDLDAGDGWESDDGIDSDSGSEPAGTDSDDPADGGDGGDTEVDDDCLDLAWEGYQVSGTCPGLPATGSIEQPEGCAIAIPGELGVQIGESGTVEGTLVTTERCTGVAAILAAPKVDLVCVIDNVSCEVQLNGSASNSL